MAVVQKEAKILLTSLQIAKADDMVIEDAADSTHEHKAEFSHPMSKPGKTKFLPGSYEIPSEYEEVIPPGEVPEMVEQDEIFLGQAEENTPMEGEASVAQQAEDSRAGQRRNGSLDPDGGEDDLP
ncbi:UNVERIFIED_CONTAM: hypothetical protein K2H54_020708 [Gekko kuhli]